MHIQKLEVYIYIYILPIFGYVSEAYSESRNGYIYTQFQVLDMYLKPIQKAEMHIYINKIPIFGYVSEAYSESRNVYIYIYNSNFWTCI